jgi:hypothetical protein
LEELAQSEIPKCFLKALKVNGGCFTWAADATLKQKTYRLNIELIRIKMLVVVAMAKM